MKKIISIVSLIICLAHCTAKKKTPTETWLVPSEKELAVAQKTNPSATLIDLNAGRAIYFNQCRECHKTHEITKFSERKWKHEIDDMSPKANLTDEQKSLLSNYILSYREANTVVSK